MLAETGNRPIWKERLNNTKWILTLLIVLYHIPVPANAEGLQTAALFYIKNLGDCVVTSFAFISGFLFFYNAHDLSAVYAKMKKRMQTLLIPYMLWNILHSLYLIARSRGISGFLHGVITANWIRNMIAWDSSPHFWYIFKLLFWTVLAPLLFIVYKDKRLLIVLLLLQLIYYIYKGSDILTSRHIYILYVWGGGIGIRFPDFWEKIGHLDDRKRKVIFYTCLIIYIAIRLPYNNIENNGILVWCYSVRTIFLLSALINAPFEYIGAKTGYAFSFWIFATHYYMDAVISDYVSRLVPIPAVQIVSWIVVFAITLMSGMVLKCTCPQLFSILTGSRSNKNNS